MSYAKSLLDIALEGQSEEYRRKVLELAFKDFELAFDRWMARINKTLANCDRVAVEKQEGQIAEVVNSLVRQTELTKVATSVRSLVVAAGIVLTTLVSVL